MRNKCIAITLFIGLICVKSIFAQWEGPSLTIPRPNTTSLGLYEEQPGSYVAGLPDNSIPLHKIKGDEYISNSSDTRMTPYMHEPLAGVTSQSDAGQPENCLICAGSDPNWQNTTTAPRCKSGSTTGEIEREQRDVNICSFTYYQTRWVVVGTNCATCPAPANWQNTATATRCKEGTTTGETEQEQRDISVCSSTYNQTRWVVVGTNCTTCPAPANWQNTATATRCKSGSTTGEIEQEQRDINVCSSTYDQTRWVVVGSNCTTCPAPANWQNTATATRCKSGSTAGEIEQEQQDIETCSNTYNQTRWVVVGTNCATCPAPANWQNTATATRCKAGTTIGEIEQEQRDINVCSSTYDQTRWVVAGTNCTTCPAPANWQNTATATRCKSGSTTGEIEQEQQDIETCSSTYNQTRWVVVGTNCTTCPAPANWQNTATATRCKAGTTTGEIEQEQQDIEACSSTYNQIRWVVVSTNCTTCPAPANWQNTATATRCKAGTTTGEIEQEQIDVNVCSSTYNQIRWVVVGTNCITCPAPANWQNTATATRCKAGSTTGQIEQEQKDVNVCSSTYNQIRWVVVSINCTTCPAPANWQNTTTATRCKAGSTTGEIEQEQKDVNVCSSTYIQIRWVVVGTNCTTCPAPANWQNTATATRCKAGTTTGEIEQEQKDVNVCSSTYNQTRWVVVGTNCTTCPAPANWQNTTTPLRCQKDGSNQNTGYQEQEQRDVNVCSSTYNQIRWVAAGYNTTACPLPYVCSSQNCSGIDQRCVDGYCEWGIQVYTGSYYDPYSGMHVCTYHYEWSDGYWSSDYYEYSPYECFLSY